MYPTHTGWYVEWLQNGETYSAGLWWTYQEAVHWVARCNQNGHERFKDKILYKLPMV
jgi:hypothetical protein